MVACIVAQSLIATFSSRRSRQSSQDPEEIEHMPCDDGGGGSVGMMHVQIPVGGRSEGDEVCCL